MSKNIYLDYAATTPTDKKVLATMMPYFNEKYGNASSLHTLGQEASLAVEEARKKIADFLGAKAQEIIFTGGATESNNLTIKGIVQAYYGSKIKDSKKLPHIITTAFEHHCILNAVKNLEKKGLIEATFIKPEKDGLIAVEKIKKALQKNTILVSVMYVNNEIGTVQPIAKIGQLIKKHNQALAKNQSEILFHTDATQAINYFDCRVNKLGVDLLSLSAHKIYGPKGVGALYIRQGISIETIQDGGGQENGMRSGTTNSPGIIGMGIAIKEIARRKREIENKKMITLRNHLIRRVLKEIPKVRLNGSQIKRSPNNANFSFLNVEGESLIMLLSEQGVMGSTGSACSSASLAPSHVLLSLGYQPEETHGSLRLTLGKQTTKKDIDKAVNKLKKIITQLRKVSGNVLADFYQKK